MAAGYQQLLDATIQYLENLKAKGIRFVSVSPARLAALSSSRPQPIGRAEAVLSLAPASPTHASASGESTMAARPATPANSQTSLTAHGSFEPAVPVSRASASPGREAKQAAMAQVQARASVCRKCPHLAASRKNVVFGVGAVDSPLMFVGEAPGADEDEQGEPFVGRAGQLLTKIIQAMGFRRDTVYIANILKCRPDTPGQRTGNRKPTAEEMKTCLPYLLAQVEVIQPVVIVALGATAVEGLLGLSGGITKLRGQWQEFRGVPVMPTYHPAFLLRNEALREKRKVWEDMLQVLEKLGQPISDRQRNYFLGG